MPRKTHLALNVELAAVDGAAPEWVELIPAGPNVTGLDGRSWVFDQLAADQVLATFGERGLDVVIDWNHATQLQAPTGGDAPAAAWIKQLESRDGALWGQVDWTPRGGQQVLNREYKYLSPVFDYDPTTKRIARLVSAAILNTPNLRLTALNSEETPVALSAAIAGALGLTADATDEAAIAAITQLKTAQAANSENPSLERFVPRSDYDTLQARAVNAEQALATRDAAEHTAAVDTAISGALAAGKITPATEAYHRASCSDSAGLARFKDYVNVAAVIAPDQKDLDKPGGATETALNAEELAVCQATGLDPAAFLATKATK
ncbi:phage protease [Luteibacter sp.]|jgi:phage I-like protein|uniref:phage protease n=1 Tax=Luteibacter sp. TaxID=1886636 RepID=UPI002F40C468